MADKVDRDTTGSLVVGIPVQTVRAQMTLKFALE
jgi:hypothetical protein